MPHTPAKASEAPDGVPTPSKRSGGVLRGRWDAQDMANDSVAHFTRTDPGQSVPGNCVHDWFRAGKWFRCHWCPAKIQIEEES